MEIYQIIISAFITIFSVGLLAVSFASYRKYNNQKLLFVSLVFFIFLIKGILLSLQLFYPGLLPFSDLLITGFFDLCILVLLFIATLKR
jgi:hypothetical protein